MSRVSNVEIFNDTERIVQENKKLRDSVENTINNQKVYPADCKIIPEKRDGQDARIIVSGKRTLEAA